MFFKRVWVTGDTHGQFDWLKSWCKNNHTTYEDALIILGDAGIMYYDQEHEQTKKIKQLISECPITLLCIRGNHEARPIHTKGIEFIYEENDPVIPSGYYYESAYPNIRYIADGSTFNINGNRCLFIGGAYSVDKEYRLMSGWRWFEDEELTDEEMTDILDKIDHKHYDYVFTHTCPEKWQPRDLFLSIFDQSKVSKKMEQFLTTVSEIITFRYWYFGHYHDNRHMTNREDSYQIIMLYDNVEPLEQSYHRVI